MENLITAACPYCGEPVELYIDEGGAGHQVYVEDCPVCCNPWQVEVTGDRVEGWQLSLRTIDE